MDAFQAVSSSHGIAPREFGLDPEQVRPNR